MPLDEEARMRHAIEASHSAAGDLGKLWGYLSHSDRNVRYAARVAIERDPGGQHAMHRRARRKYTRKRHGPPAPI